MSTTQLSHQMSKNISLIETNPKSECVILDHKVEEVIKPVIKLAHKKKPICCGVKTEEELNDDIPHSKLSFSKSSILYTDNAFLKSNSERMSCVGSENTVIKDDDEYSDLYFIVNEIFEFSSEDCLIRNAIDMKYIDKLIKSRNISVENLCAILNIKLLFPETNDIYVLHEEDYEIYERFFDKLTFLLHDGHSCHKINDGINFCNIFGYENLDLNENKVQLKVMYCEVVVRRNVTHYALNGSITIEKRAELVNMFKAKFREIFAKFSLTTIPDQWIMRLMEEEKYLFSTRLMRDFPRARSNMIYQDDGDATLGALINFDDHLQVVASTNSGRIGYVFNKINQILNSVTLSSVEFIRHNKFGYITVNPKYLGSGTTIRVHVKLPFVSLLDDVEELYLKDLNLSLRPDYEMKHLMVLSNRRSLNITEETTFHNIVEGFRRLYDLDMELSRTSPKASLNFTMPVESLLKLTNKITNCDGCKTYTKKYLVDSLVHQYNGVNTYFYGLLNHCIRANAFYPHSLFPKATDPECYFTFSRFFNLIIFETNGIRQMMHPAQPNYEEISPIDRYTFTHKLIKQYRVRFARNLQDYPFPMLISPDIRKEIENKIVKAIESISNSIPGKYIKLCNIRTDSLYNMLMRYNLIPKAKSLIKKASYVYRDWPENRGIFVADTCPEFPDQILIIIVNEDDHFKVICISKTGLRMDLCYNYALKVIKLLDDYFEGKYAKKSTFGFLSSNPQNVGCCMRISAKIKLKYLAVDNSALNEFCVANSMNYRGLNGSGSNVVGNIYEVSFKININYNEYQIFVLFMQRLKDLISEERKYDSSIPGIMDSFISKTSTIDITENEPTQTKTHDTDVTNVTDKENETKLDLVALTNKVSTLDRLSVTTSTDTHLSKKINVEDIAQQVSPEKFEYRRSASNLAVKPYDDKGDTESNVILSVTFSSEQTEETLLKDSETLESNETNEVELNETNEVEPNN